MGRDNKTSIVASMVTIYLLMIGMIIIFGLFSAADAGLLTPDWW